MRKVNHLQIRKYIGKDIIIYGLAGIILFLFLAAFTYKEEKGDRTVYDIVCLGDSILGQVRAETSIVYLLEEQLGCRIFNGAFGGTTMSRLGDERNLARNKDGLSMTALALAIGYDDFSVQRTVNFSAYGNGSEHFPDTMEALSALDFTQTRILMIGHGMNDYRAEVPLVNPENPYDSHTFEGALRTTLETLQKQYPELRLILVTPTYSWILEAKMTCEEWNAGCGFLEDYVELEISIAREYDVEVIDLYHDFYPHDSWEDLYTYTYDGTHPNDAGREEIAARIAAYLKE